MNIFIRKMLPSVTVHSTFRDDLGKRALPYGLDWNVAGESHVAYAVLPPCLNASSSDDHHPPGKLEKNTTIENDTNHPEFRRVIVEAHNKWSFAKDLPFRQVDEIQNVTWSPSGHHLLVKWNDYQAKEKGEYYTIQQTAGLVRLDKSAQGDAPPAQVWINGELLGVLLQPETVEQVIKAVAQTPSRKLSFQRCNGMIRIERRFVGMIRGYDVFEHVLDNLYAMEDPQLLSSGENKNNNSNSNMDDNNNSNINTDGIDNNKTITLIGTATLPDWIMGGELTSRIWIQQDGNEGKIQFLRPLYHDDIQTADRKYQLVPGKSDDDDQKIAVIQQELQRLRYLATLPHPYDNTLCDNSSSSSSRNNSEEEKKELESPLTEREIQHKRNTRRKFFGL